MAVKPIYLFADSQLLFWSDEERRFLDSVRKALDADAPRAAYVGASNGDRPEYFSLFTGAMDLAGFRDCRMISSRYEEDDRACLKAADIILLAGGDVHFGWQIMSGTGLGEDLLERYREGALLMGVSAGAVQLGLKGWTNDRPAQDDLFACFGLVPCVVDAHDEDNDWGRLQRVVTVSGPPTYGVGLPAGSGLICHVDGTLEPLRRPLTEILYQGLEIGRTLLVPSDA